MKKKINKIPNFKNEDEERDFWSTHSFADYLDQFKEVQMDFSKLKPSTSRVTFRLPDSMLYDLKLMANKRDVPYQSLIKTILHDRIQAEFYRPSQH